SIFFDELKNFALWAPLLDRGGSRDTFPLGKYGQAGGAINRIIVFFKHFLHTQLTRGLLLHHSFTLSVH
ncbi:MAG TPA: hypothetical protein VLL97_07005, partial [Acidobacteriota bacterium]|nr:hypothetical protein [Acidobacteriota bacterium]